jgi:hypothetical protein
MAESCSFLAGLNRDDPMAASSSASRDIAKMSDRWSEASTTLNKSRRSKEQCSVKLPPAPSGRPQVCQFDQQTVGRPRGLDAHGVFIYHKCGHGSDGNLDPATLCNPAAVGVGSPRDPVAVSRIHGIDGEESAHAGDDLLGWRNGTITSFCDFLGGLGWKGLKVEGGVSNSDRR